MPVFTFLDCCVCVCGYVGLKCENLRRIIVTGGANVTNNGLKSLVAGCTRLMVSKRDEAIQPRTDWSVLGMLYSLDHLESTCGIPTFCIDESLTLLKNVISCTHSLTNLIAILP